jgi:transcriptional regulator with XRE-family HTH domain
MTIDSWLAQQGMTETEFAKAIGCTQAAVNRYRNGRVPNVQTMRRIVKATSGQVQPNDFYALTIEEVAA